MATDVLIRRSGVTTGVKVQAVSVTTTDATISGTFIHGETVTGGTSTATGKFVYFDEAADKIFLRDRDATSFSNSETLTGGTSGATVTSAASVAEATEFNASYVTVGRVKNQVQLQQSRNVQQITDFETAEDDFFDVITDGKQGSISWTSNLVPTNDGFGMANQAFEGNLTSRIQITRTSIDGTSYQAEAFEGFFDNVSRTYNESGVAEAQFNLTISAVV